VKQPFVLVFSKTIWQSFSKFTRVNGCN